MQPGEGVRSVLFALMILAQTPPPLPTATPDYEVALEAFEARRVDLEKQYRRARGPARVAVLESARTVVFASIRDTILPAWSGTPWDFYGTAERPREGTIACGYFVATVLRDAGFR